MELEKILITLAEASGASGSENDAAETALSMLRKYCTDAEIKNGNVIGYVGGRDENKKTVLLDAHLDQIGFVVTHIEENGFVKFSNLGGIDRRLLPAQQVVIRGKQNIRGVIGSVPPHLSNGESSVPTYDNLAIDTGMTAEELSKYVSPGDAITFDNKCHRLLGSRITGQSFDDRCGIAAILYALDLLRNSEPDCNLAVLFSTQEELGERGAAIGGFEINPDIAIAVDVSFGYVTGENELKCGKLGKGPMIGISPSLSREISDKLTDTAEKNGIPYQIEVMNGLTSTNADRFSVCRGGAKACTVSIPLRYMHTPVEVIDIRDVEFSGRLLAAYIKEAQK
ncbi:MAG: M42 family metallopeptidase [Ruminococcus sp.]